MEQEQTSSVVQQMLKNGEQVNQESCTQVHGGSDTKPQPKFDPNEDVTALIKAIKAKEVDEGTIIDILTKRTNEQRQRIKAAYQKETGKSLEEDLKKALSGQLETIILALLKTPAQFDASELKSATKGLGTDENTLIEILTTRTNQEIKQIVKVYKEEFKTDIEKDIAGDTSGDFQKMMLALLKGERSEDSFVNEDLADKDAKALFEAGEKAKVANVSVFINILTSRSLPQLRKVFQNYRSYSKHDVTKMMDLKLKGDIESSLVAMVKVTQNKPGFFADQLNSAMKGTVTQDKVLTRVIVSRHEIDLKAIKEQYKILHKKSLREALIEKTNGEYETVLVALCGYDD
ncbi:annexin A1-like [Bombina bombina]|uniref:annexin A1-like n=1 Tax=Bombina bombina TaxID=8345 RepID=UPI00235AF127|nr:annexin A1-like [Bombina bombina]XP_053556578.1 annexin A1-like [Bombina bombina]